MSKRPSKDSGTPPEESAPLADSVDPNPDSVDASSNTTENISAEGLAADHATVYDGFDPDIHAVNADGTPKRKANGDYALKRGRKTGRAATALPPKNAANGPAVGAPVKDSLVVANQVCNLFIHLSVQVFGDEWKPDDKPEAEGLRDSVKDYFDQKGVPDIPPVFGLILAFGAYGLKRFSHENTRTKLQTMGLKIYNGFQWIKSKMRKD